MGYHGPIGAEGVSNSETTGATLTTNPDPKFDRAIALISADGTQRWVTAQRAPNPSYETVGVDLNQRIDYSGN